MTDTEQVTPCYSSGMRIEVGIVMPDATIFRDWAIINDIDEDFLLLQLSRDILPSGVNLRVGQILSIRSEIDFQIYSARAYIVSKGYDQELLLRLTGEIIPEESREFYRINSFLPFKIHILPDQDPIAVMNQWEKKQIQRREDERIRELKRENARRERLQAEDRAKKLVALNRILTGCREPIADRITAQEEDVVADEYDESWDFILASAINISAGGLKITTHQEFKVDECVLLEIFTPSSRRIVDVVARIVFINRVETDGENKMKCSVGMEFILLTESDRFAISNHISSLQLGRIRQMKGLANVKPAISAVTPQPEMSPTISERTLELSGYRDSDQGTTRQQTFLQMFFWSLVICFIVPLCLYGLRHLENQPKNQIQVQVERGISGIIR